MSFYEVLSEIMEEQNMSIPDVARACDLPDSTIRSIITRESQTVKLDVAFKISEGLNVSLERLNGDPEPVQKTSAIDERINDMWGQLTPQEREYFFSQIKDYLKMRGQ